MTRLSLKDPEGRRRELISERKAPAVVAAAFLIIAPMCPPGAAQTTQKMDGQRAAAPSAGQGRSVSRPPGPPVPSTGKESDLSAQAALAYVTAMGLVAKNDFDRAIDKFGEAIRLEPDPRMQAFLLHARGFFLLNLKGDAQRALGDLDEAIRVDPNPVYILDRARAWIRLGKFENAIADATLAIRLDPQSEWYALPVRGEAYMHQADYAHALADLDQAIKLRPDNDEAWATRALVRMGMNQLERAIADADQAVKLKPGSETALFYRAHIHKAMGQESLAMADLKKILDINPGHTAAKKSLEEILGSSGQK
jgi:tetratricopeptide (TPR) repeat protein